MPFYSTSIADFEQANVCWNIWKPFILQMSKAKLRKYDEMYMYIIKDTSRRREILRLQPSVILMF